MLYQIIAITLLVTFYGSYFIKMFLQSKNGINTNQLGKDKHGFVKFIEISVKIITIVIFIVQVISIILNTYSFSNILRIVGLIVAASGVTVFICAIVQMKDSWRAGVSKSEKTNLVTTGIYRFSRNPAFVGFDLLYIGILLMFFNYILLVISLSAILMFHLQIVNVEEDFLLETFGDEYLAYKKKVKRY